MKHTSLILPFSGDWLTFWGGDTAELNHHYKSASQRYAFDFIQTDDHGNFYATDGTTNSDYYSFGEDIVAPANGVIVEAVDGVRDNKPGFINPYSIAGNYVLIRHTNNEFSLLAHLRNGSVISKAGSAVLSGQKIGECGNSGNSSDPHLHYQLQNSDVFAQLNKEYKQEYIAKGIKVTFSDVTCKSDGKVTRHKLYSPIKGDIVRQN